MWSENERCYRSEAFMFSGRYTYDIMLLIYEGILTPILMGEDSLLERVTAAAEDA